MSKELFDKKYVFCMWDDKLSGKEVFVANYISDLMEYVDEDNISCRRDYVLDSNAVDWPFAVHNSLEEVGEYKYCYYDPLYDIKRAYYKEGRTIQYWDEEYLLWKDVQHEPNWDLGSIKYRIKEAKEFKFEEED